METRVCELCQKEKSLEEFYRNKTRPLGRDYWCKECRLQYDSQNHRKARHLKWAKSDRGKQKRKDYSKEYYAKNRNKIIAQRMVQKLVKMGVIQKMPCQECGETKVNGHHPDYTKPLEVKWLCQKHHWEAHNR